MEYIIHILIVIGIYTILSVSLNLLAGYTGLLSVAHAAFYSVGAYVAAIMSLQLNMPFLAVIFFATILSSILGILLSLLTLRISDDYFLIATFAFQMIVFSVLMNWVSLTGGPMGIPGIPELTIIGIHFSSNTSFFILVSSFCAMAIWITNRIVNSSFGRVLKAIREDETFTRAVGKNIAVFKVTVLMISAIMAAIAGVLYAYYFRFIDPTSFTVMESIFILSIVIIGGAGSKWGPVLGAAVLVLLPELLRLIGLPNSIAADLRQIIYGAMLVLFMILKPSGLFGEFKFQRSEA